MTLALQGEVYVASDVTHAYDALGAALTQAALEAVEERGAFHLALSGGSTPEGFYVHLVTDPRFRLIPWPQTHIWQVDERRVPQDHEQSNYRMIRETLVDHIPIRKRCLHPMHTLEVDADQHYEKELREVFGSPGQAFAGVPSLDMILLGMGDDGHTASLFPRSEAASEKQKLIVIARGEAVKPPERVSMTFPLINAARQVAVLVTGAKKQPMLRQIESQLRRGPDPVNLPITGVKPVAGEMCWYLDEAAAGE